MDGISSWALSISICAVICTIVEVLISDSRLEKTVRFILGVFMVCAVIFPLGSVISGFSSISLDESSSIEVDDKLSAQQEELIKSQISMLIEGTLEDMEIYPEKIEVNMDIDENESISLITAEVTLSKEYVESAGAVVEAVMSELGLECEVVFMG